MEEPEKVKRFNQEVSELKRSELLFKDEPHGCLDYSQGYDRCEKQCDRCKDL